MFVPKLYRNENREEMTDFIQKNNFGILVSLNENQQIIATHIPFLIQTRDNDLFLISHISKSNEQGKEVLFNQEVLIIFQGPHSYISSSWYDHLNVPTWNYIAVHVYGKARVLNHEETIHHLNELVNKHEASEKNPISLETMTLPYVEKEMKGLIAFEIKMNSILSAFKLSQNRDEKNLRLILESLEPRKDENSMAIANEIKKQLKKKQHEE